MVRELDYAKADPRRQQTRRRQRSIQVLKVLRAYSAAGALTTPSRLRDGVDLLLLDHESRSNEEALDLALPDDRLMLLRWTSAKHCPISTSLSCLTILGLGTKRGATGSIAANYRLASAVHIPRQQPKSFPANM